MDVTSSDAGGRYKNCYLPEESSQAARLAAAELTSWTLGHGHQDVEGDNETLNRDDVRREQFYQISFHPLIATPVMIARILSTICLSCFEFKRFLQVFIEV